MVTTGDDPQLEQKSKTETIVRRFDTDDKLISETTTVVTHAAMADDDLPLGMYL